jgi:hypothetical protein
VGQLVGEDRAISLAPVRQKDVVAQHDRPVSAGGQHDPAQQARKSPGSPVEPYSIGIHIPGEVSETGAFSTGYSVRWHCCSLQLRENNYESTKEHKTRSINT